MERERRHPSSRSSGPPPMDTAIGDYSIGKEIGKGSFAMVFKGVHTKTGTPVAVKAVLRSKLKKRLLENLETEIEIMKTLTHPHIVQLYEITQSSTYVHLIMEYCALGDLNVFIRKRDRVSNMPLIASIMKKFPNPPDGGLNEVLVRHFLKQMASAIAFMRERNLVHRDLKPQNILLCPPPRTEQEAIEKNHAGTWGLPVLKLADFGFARILPNTSLAETLCGSPLYMAPEILRYEKYDAKADLWSIGAILYELCMGKAPFKAENYVDLVRKIEKNEDRINFAETVPVSEPLKRLIRGLLRRNPVERMGFKEFFEDDAVRGEIPQVQEAPSFVADMDDEKYITEYLSKPSHSKASSSSPRKSSKQSSPPPQTPAVATADTANSEPGPSPAAIPSRPSQVPIPQRLPSGGKVHQTATPVAAAAAAPPTPAHRSASPPRAISSFANRRPSLERIEEPKQPLDEAQSRPPLKSTSSASSSAPQTVPGLQQESRAREHSSSQSSSRRSSAFSIQTPPITSAFNGPLAGTPSMGKPEDDIMFEHEYVVVEKRTVEVNAFADELANNSPKQTAHQRRYSSSSSSFRPILSRANSSSGRSGSFGRYGESPTSTLGRALAMASARLIGRSSTSNASRGSSPREHHYVDEPEMAVILKLEDAAVKSNAVYEFANVKFSQLMPSTPSSNVILTSDLTPQAIVGLSEEALVLYVKSLSLLAAVMDLAASWWMSKDAARVSPRIVTAVEWIRERFNEALNKAQLVRMKLANPTGGVGAPTPAATAEDFSTGVTAEKLLYDRAVEMSKSAAMNEIMGEGLAECETMYETSILMLQAILDSDGDAVIEEDDARSVETIIAGIRDRLATLRKKLEAQQAGSVPGSTSASRTSNAASFQQQYVV
ncbi:kinase-like domain-containing protein [Myxozyma melibiosi]|uniref:Serine/threonine-protein kinase ATG1 n=1 Tax=Myxozyma melibiosi TaxID=54550 RepID=A0ABR1F4G6_9ASCO